MNKLIPGKEIADSILKDLKQAISNHSKKPVLAVILASYDESSKVYVDLKLKKAEEVGIKTHLLTFPEAVTPQELINSIEDLNNNQEITGILLQLPLYNHLENHTEKIVNSINYSKDVDGLTAYQQGMVAHLSEKAILPATVEAVLECLQYTTDKNISWKNRKTTEFKTFLRSKDVVIVNDSNLIGRPLALLLNSMGATVTLCNEFTHDIIEVTQEADYLITATGNPHIFDYSFVKKDAVIIDVTSVRTNDGVKGDFKFDDNVINNASFITPVPGGVGPLTIACLLRNVVNASLEIE